MIEILLKAVVFVGAFFFMEFMAWFTHKYIMHGFLWVLHADHHSGRKGFFQRNDFFFLIFAVPGSLLSIFGAANGFDYMFWVGAGITAYGLTYFLVHDVFIHRRFKLFGKTENHYFKALRKAHAVHHKKVMKEGGESFGMLVVPRKFFTKANKIPSSKSTS